jgi:hypothetical protein
LEALCISAGPDALSSSDLGANTGSSSTTPVPRAPRIVDLRPGKGNGKEKTPEPNLEPLACTSQANHDVLEGAPELVVAALNNTPSTTSVITSLTAVEKHRFLPCGGSLVWEATGDQLCYKCSKCVFNIKHETIRGYFLEFRTTDGVKIRIDNEEVWASHYNYYVPDDQSYSCKVCWDGIFSWSSLEWHLKKHTREELFLSYPGAYIPK